jgi:hypothetical protein
MAGPTALVIAAQNAPQRYLHCARTVLSKLPLLVRLYGHTPSHDGLERPMTALLIAVVGLFVAVIGKAIIDPSTRPSPKPALTLPRA